MNRRERTENPFAGLLRDLRENAGLTLAAVEHMSGGRYKAVVVGSYERDGRSPTVGTLDALLRDVYGYRLAVVDADMDDGHVELASWLARQDVTEVELQAAVALVRAARESVAPVLRAVA